MDKVPIVALPVDLSYRAQALDVNGASITVGLYADKQGKVQIAPVVDGKLQIPPS